MTLASLALAALQLASLDAQVNKFVADGHVAGLTCAVMQGDRVLYHRAFGYRNAAKREPARLDDLYRLASASKPITAVGFMALVERGKITLDEPAKLKLGFIPERHPAFTYRQLLSHTAGVRHYVDSDIAIVFRHFQRAKPAAEFILRQDLIAKPGEKFSYSTHAFTLIAAGIEAVEKTSFEAYMRRAIFPFAGPGALDCEDLTEKPKSRRTGLYQFEKGSLTSSGKPEDNSWKYAGGGMEATAAGLARFGQALMAGRILKQETLAEMWKPASLNSGEATKYGLGFGVGTPGIVQHSGAQQGARSCFLLDPARKMSVVVLTNTEGEHDVGALANQLYQHFADQ